MLYSISLFVMQSVVFGYLHAGQKLVYAYSLPTNEKDKTMTDFHELEMHSITGEPQSFKQYKGQLCLVVNVASQ